MTTRRAVVLAAGLAGSLATPLLAAGAGPTWSPPVDAAITHSSVGEVGPAGLAVARNGLQLAALGSEPDADSCRGRCPMLVAKRRGGGAFAPATVIGALARAPLPAGRRGEAFLRERPIGGGRVELDVAFGRVGHRRAFHRLDRYSDYDFSSNAQIAADSRGDVAVAWIATRSGSGSGPARLAYARAGHGFAAKIPLVPGDSDSLALTMGADGRAVVAVQHDDRLEVRATSRGGRAGSLRALPGALGALDGSDRCAAAVCIYPQAALTVGRRGQVIVAWTRAARAGSKRAMLSVATIARGGVSFGTPLIIDPQLAGLAPTPIGLSVDVAGNVALVWTHSDQNPDLVASPAPSVRARTITRAGAVGPIQRLIDGSFLTAVASRPDGGLIAGWPLHIQPVGGTSAAIDQGLTVSVEESPGSGFGPPEHLTDDLIADNGNSTNADSEAIAPGAQPLLALALAFDPAGRPLAAWAAQPTAGQRYVLRVARRAQR